ncbi:MAG: tetratricopeptide repeat protein [Candidatus Methylacidiphilales bacterium]
MSTDPSATPDPVDTDVDGEIAEDYGPLLRLLTVAESLLPWMFTVALCSFVVLYTFVPQVGTNDMGWHITQGRWMWANGAALGTDIFNYPNAGNPLVNEYPLFQLIIACVYHYAETGPALLNAVCWVGLFGWICIVAIRLKGFGAIMATLLLSIIVMSLGRLVLRPELMTYFGVLFFMLWLLRYAGGRAPKSWLEFWPLAAVQVAWINCHSGFIVGLAILGFFAAEMLIREVMALRKNGSGLSWVQAVRASHLGTWTGGVLLVGAACLINPYGLKRLLLPFYHHDSFVIKVYATEMQPLPWDMSDPLVAAMAVGLGLVVLGYALYRGQGSYAFLLLVLLMAWQAMDARRHVALAGFMMPGALLSVVVMGSPWAALTGTAARVGSAMALAVVFSLTLLSVQGESGVPAARWEALKNGHYLMPYAATDWMRRPDVALDGRMIHRTEIGGWLQYHGFGQGQTFCDTGFGKFPSGIVHLSGLLADRPDWLPAALERYKPDIAVVAAMSFEWPAHLKAAGWRLVMYHPSGSIYLRPGFRPELPTVSDAEVQRIFLDFMAGSGPPSRGLLYMYYVMTLNYMGLNDFAIEQWRSSRAPKTDRYYWYYPATCFFQNPAQRQDLLDAIYVYAQQADQMPRSGQFRARYLASKGNWAEALALAKTLPRVQADPILVAQCLSEQGENDALLALLLDRRQFEVNESRRYYMLAVLYEKLNRTQDALQPARYAAYFQPDDVQTLALARRLIDKTGDASLKAIVADPVMAPLPPGPVP